MKRYSAIIVERIRLPQRGRADTFKSPSPPSLPLLAYPQRQTCPRRAEHRKLATATKTHGAADDGAPGSSGHLSGGPDVTLILPTPPLPPFPPYPLLSLPPPLLPPPPPSRPLRTPNAPPRQPGFSPPGYICVNYLLRGICWRGRRDSCPLTARAAARLSTSTPTQPNEVRMLAGSTGLVPANRESGCVA